VAFAEVRLPTPWFVVKPSGGMVFVCCPGGEPAGAVTGTEIVHVPGVVMLPAGMVPPVRVTLFVVVVTLPPQVVVAVPATTNGGGRVSVTLTPVKGVVLGFCRVMISVVVPPGESVTGVNRFVRPNSRTFRRAVTSVAFVRF
jgi:hypothetical protein